MGRSRWASQLPPRRTPLCHSDIDPEEDRGGYGRIHLAIHFLDIDSKYGSHPRVKWEYGSFAIAQDDRFGLSLKYL